MGGDDGGTREGPHRRPFYPDDMGRLDVVGANGTLSRVGRIRTSCMGLFISTGAAAAAAIECHVQRLGGCECVRVCGCECGCVQVVRLQRYCWPLHSPPLPSLPTPGNSNRRGVQVGGAAREQPAQPHEQKQWWSLKPAPTSRGAHHCMHAFTNCRGSLCCGLGIRPGSIPAQLRPAGGGCEEQSRAFGHLHSHVSVLSQNTRRRPWQHRTSSRRLPAAAC
jgi:hypothetical protein